MEATVEIAHNNMTKCLRRLPTPEPGTWPQVDRVVERYIGLCGQEFTWLWQIADPFYADAVGQPGRNPRKPAMLMSTLAANHALGCQFIDDKQHLLPEADEKGRVSCLVQNRVDY